jgi:hypothetical protein
MEFKNYSTDRIVVGAPRSKGLAFLVCHPLEVITRWADYFGDDEGSLQRGRELVHAIGLLDAPEDEVANVEGSFLNIAVMVALKLLVVTGLSHDSSCRGRHDGFARLLLARL